MTTFADCVVSYHQVFRHAVRGWLADRAPSMGAALAYYTLFSLAPLLLIVVAVAGMVFGQDAANGQIYGQLKGLMGASGAAAVQGLLSSVNWPAGGVINTIVGLVLMLVGATTVFAELQGTLDHIWRAPERPPGGIWGFLRARMLSFGLILGLGFLLMVSLVVSAVISALSTWSSAAAGAWDAVVAAVSQIMNFLMTVLLFAMIYKIMPRMRISWADVWIGALVTGSLFTLGRVLIGFYISGSAVASGFGAAGSLVIVLLWVYFSAQIFLLGAEFTWAYAHLLGSKRDDGRPPPTRDHRPTTGKTAPAAATE